MNRQGKVLIVDDEYTKVQKIITNANQLIEAEFDHVTNSRDALKKVQAEKFDLIIIDLQIPLALGNDINPNGGRELLEYIEENCDLYQPSHILGITSHEESYNSCKAAFDEKGWSLFLAAGNYEVIAKIIDVRIRHAIEPTETYDIAILTALRHVELEQVLDLPCNWLPIKNPDDCHTYYSGSIQNSLGVSTSIIATSCPRMGIANAAATSMKMSLKFTPKYILMTGISAGVKGQVNLGDILIADPCWDWGNGKQTLVDGKPTLLAAPHQIALKPSLRSELQELTTNRTYLDDISDGWQGDEKRENVLNSHLGPIATGAVVLEDPAVVDNIRDQHRETIGVEMEAYGFAVAASLASNAPPIPLVIKSVCDFADPSKNNKWQSYAAYTSTQFAFKLIENHLR